MSVRRMGLWLGLGAMAAGLVACGGSSSGSNDGIPAVATTSQSAAPSASGTALAGGAQAELASYVAAQRKWVACMRTHNVDLPDPDKYGLVELHARPAGWLTAYRACRSLQVAEPASVQQLQLPKLTSAQITLAFKLSRCMQTHGVPGYPDPDPNGYIPASKDALEQQGSSGWQVADRQCSPLVPVPSGAPTPRG